MSTSTEDEVYTCLQRHFLMQGKGRRPDLPERSLTVTHDLLLKLYFFMLDGGQNYKELKSWLVKLVPNTEKVTESLIAHQVNMVLKKCSSCSKEEAEQFLSEEYDFHSVQPPLSAFGLNRLHLLDIQAYKSDRLSKLILTNEVVVSLEHFRSRETLPPFFVRKWIGTLCYSPHPALTDKQLRSKVDKVVQQYNKLLRSKSINPQMIQDFLKCAFFNPPGNLILDSVNVKSDIVKDENKSPCAECIKLRETLVEKDKIIKDLKNENEKFCRLNNDLTEVKQAKEELVMSLNLDRQKKEALEKDLKALKLRLKQSQTDRKLALDELEEMKKTKLYKKNHSVKKNLLEASEKNNQLVK
ncbi:hypothetical protein PoB_001499100 [Plakobranchus ocellatus]|uniref:Uncharacterized protein n=1 Tax=Plakobranchus ocellatus TaxID=259542 RepID=A0AAV3YY60_9GAST|nr:hypothetical protein PoB_001499100 [Plakobranchus ocellatus]